MIKGMMKVGVAAVVVSGLAVAMQGCKGDQKPEEVCTSKVFNYYNSNFHNTKHNIRKTVDINREIKIQMFHCCLIILVYCYNLPITLTKIKINLLVI